MSSYHPAYLRQIIRTALQPINLWSDNAEELLLMTAAHESHLGKYLHQFGGPALGLYGMEPFTLYDIWTNYLNYRLNRTQEITNITGISGPDLGQLQYNPIYNTIMARLHYRRAPGLLPKGYDIPAMAEYAKAHYNTALGQATMEKYMVDYQRLILQ